MKTQAAYYLASSSLSIIPSVRPIVSKTPAAAIPHRASNPASTAGPSSSNDNEVDGKGLWNKNGMNTLVNWITDADSYDSYFGKRLADVTLSHLQEEIAQHINQQNISKGKLGHGEVQNGVSEEEVRHCLDRAEENWRRKHRRGNAYGPCARHLPLLRETECCISWYTCTRPTEASSITRLPSKQWPDIDHFTNLNSPSIPCTIGNP
ncbi:hypothetical protein BC939DRAFT_478430 [Gamsiella multidivaricata]|uniref:uncharacterized protein n=1 Tax=Gamsiella multidivaricata TaxID=101098 RepID=UPI00222085C4|nr:uncharacterized protein BC939DRAFT_478430 [Gamsiella multidivaricata]KAI7821197.1 hypothetical protein BC939DRAFT_478430 [Gamsiella multidivaricata]